MYLCPVRVSMTSGQGLLAPSLSMSARALPASFEVEKSHLCRGPSWPAIRHRASANWNCMMVRVKYLKN